MKILFAWEIGGNLGHIAKHLPLLRLLRQRGHELLFASKEIELAQRLLAPAGIVHVQAPLVTRFTGGIREPASFADILAEIGFADANALAGLLSGWRNLFALYKPDVLVAGNMRQPRNLLPGYMVCLVWVSVRVSSTRRMFGRSHFFVPG